MIRVAMIVILIVASLVYPRVVVPVSRESGRAVRINLVELVPVPAVAVEPEPESTIMTITAYTKNDRGMNGKGITANGERVQEGRTIAADKSIPFGTEIYIPEMERTFVVSDRGEDISRGRLDVFMESRKDALEFGVQNLEVIIRN